MRKIDLLLSYLKSHRNYVCLLGILFAVECVIFYLYRLPLIAVGYALLLCAVLLLIWFCISFYKYNEKHKLLNDFKAKAEIGGGQLPAAKDITELDYQDIIHTLEDELHKLTYESAAQQKDMLDYYTMWVHQIKTPIAAMKLFLSSDTSQEAAALSGELFKIEQYVEMVLSYLRLSSDSTDYVFAPCSLESIVRESVRKYARLFVLKKLSLTFEPADTTVLTDSKWLSFVIDQILSNALKYTQSGGITITIVPDEKKLMISDTGIGISPQDLPRIFDKGFTGCNGRLTQKSSGLGLYLCRRILDNLSHEISITSTLSQGTTVTIDLDSYNNVRLDGKM